MPNTTCRSPKINVATGDYSIADGQLEEDTTAASEVILVLRSRRGSSPVATWYGSRIHTITKLTRAARKLSEFYAREALQFLLDRGVIRDLTTTAKIEGRALVLVVAYRDRTGKPRSVTYEHRVLG